MSLYVRKLTLGAVTFQDDDQGWHEAASWSPDDAHQEVLYFTDEGLRPAPVNDAWSFQAGRLPADDFCSSLPGPPSLYFKTPGAAEPVVVAGNPFLFLQTESSQPGGDFRAALYDVPSDWAPCAEAEPVVLTLGGVDLRFHNGNMVAKDFPAGSAQPLRLDFFNIAHVVKPGRSLLLVITNGDDQEGSPFAPKITFTADGSDKSSHIVLPIVGGTWGGSGPRLEYPARPFGPAIP